VEEFGALGGEWDGEAAVAADAGAASAAAVGEVARAVPAGACLVRGCLTSLVILLLLLDGSSGGFLGGLRVLRRGKVLQSPNTATFAQFLDGSLGFAYLQFLCYARCCFRSTARALEVCQGQCVNVSLCAVSCMFLQLFSC